MVAPPSLLIPAQVPALATVTVPAAEDKQVVPPCVSDMRSVPVPTVFWLLLMEAVNPENAGVIEKAIPIVATIPRVIARGANLRRLLVTEAGVGLDITVLLPFVTVGFEGVADFTCDAARDSERTIFPVGLF